MKWLKLKRIFLILMIIGFFSIFVLSGNLILEDYHEYKENTKENNELIELAVEHNEISKESSINWEYLKSVNEDIIGWIEIENTAINYPILKDNSNLYYLKHSYNKKYNNAGYIFKTNTYPFEDFETTVYGHNMKNGTMFSMLGNYLDEEFFYSHLDIKIYTPYGNYKGKIFSAYSIGIETESKNIKNMNFKERGEYYKKASEYKLDNMNEVNKIIKLSTCSYINAKTSPTDQRYYIIASLEKTN